MGNPGAGIPELANRAPDMLADYLTPEGEIIWLKACLTSKATWITH